MKEKKDIEKQDSFRELFKELPKEKTSNNFMINVMTEVENVRIRKKQKSLWLNILFMASGAIAILITPFIVFYFLEIDIKTLIIDLFPLIESSPFIVFVGFIVLFLLISDTLFRKYMDKKKNLHSLE